MALRHGSKKSQDYLTQMSPKMMAIFEKQRRKIEAAKAARIAISRLATAELLAAARYDSDPAVIAIGEAVRADIAERRRIERERFDAIEIADGDDFKAPP